MVSYVTNWTQPAKHRYIKPFYWALNPVTTAAATPGRTRLVHFEVAEPTTVDAIIVMNYATVAGNITVGIYGPIPTEDTPVDASVIAESASTVMAGVNQIQVIPLTPITLPVGRYYVGADYSDATATFGYINKVACVLEAPSFYYDRGGGYGAFTNPCPAVTTNSTVPIITIRVVQP